MSTGKLHVGDVQYEYPLIERIEASCQPHLHNPASIIFHLERLFDVHLERLRVVDVLGDGEPLNNSGLIDATNIQVQKWLSDYIEKQGGSVTGLPTMEELWLKKMKQDQGEHLIHFFGRKFYELAQSKRAELMGRFLERPLV